jgi:hypothetical protein
MTSRPATRSAVIVPATRNTAWNTPSARLEAAEAAHSFQ